MKYFQLIVAVTWIVRLALCYTEPNVFNDTTSPDIALEERLGHTARGIAELINVERRTNTFPVPAGKDGTKFQVWRRLDTTPHEWMNKNDITYDNLNQVLKDVSTYRHLVRKVAVAL